MRTQSPIALLIDNICQLNNGAMVQVSEFLAAQPLSVRAQFIGRCAALIESAAEKDAERYAWAGGRPAISTNEGRKGS